MKKYLVYIARSLKDGFLYVGYAGDVDERLHYHNSGKTKSLRNHIPLEIIRQEEYPTRIDAVRRERQIKSYKGGEAFKKLIR